MYSSDTLKVLKTLSRFKDVAYSGFVRQDGKLAVGGGEIPVVQVRAMEGREECEGGD